MKQKIHMLYLGVSTLALMPMLAAPLAAEAQTVQHLFSIEGPVTSIYEEGGKKYIVVMSGDPIFIPDDVELSSPTVELTWEQLTDPSPLPGRWQSGFVGGTAKFTGFVDVGADGTQQAVADFIFIEPSETVLIGTLTGRTSELPATYHVNGTSVRLLDDDRVPPEDPVNSRGFLVNLDHVAIGSPMAVEGYISTDGTDVLWAFHIASDGAPMVNEGSPEVSILRAQCRTRSELNRDEMQVQGATHDPATGTVEIWNLDKTVRYGLAAVVQDVEDEQFGQYAFNESDLELAGNACPDEVRAVFKSSTGEELADATGELDVR